jgi:chromosome segregation ATPase
MEFVQASIENLAAIVQEKEQKLATITSDYEDLTKQIELHYNMIVDRDATIQQLQLQLESSTNEWESSESRAKITTQLISRASDRLTNLEKRNEILKTKIHDLNGEILTIQFETEKLKEVRPLVLCTVNPAELDSLRESLADAEHRRELALELVAEIKNESEGTIDSTRDHNEAEKREIESKLQQFNARRNELLSAIRGIERQMRDRLEQIDSSHRELEENFEMKSESEIEIHKLKTDLREIELEVVSLEANAEEERKVEDQRRTILQTIKQKLDERNEVTDTDLSRAESLLEIQRREITKLGSNLASWNEKVERLAIEIEEIESGLKRKPNLQQIIESEKGKFQRVFASIARKQLKIQQRLEIEQKALDVQIENQKKTNEQLSVGIERCIQETRKRSEFARNEKRKSKLIVMEMEELRKEIANLREKEKQEEEEHQIHPFEPPPVIQTIKPPPIVPPIVHSPRKVKKGIETDIRLLEQEFEMYDKKMNNAKLEIEQLQMESDRIGSAVKQFRSENASLQAELGEFAAIKVYWEKLRASQKLIQGPKPEKVQTKPTVKHTRGKM